MTTNQLKHSEYTLSKQDVYKLIDVAGLRNPRERLLVEILYYGGLRIAEAIALDWEDIDINGRKIIVRRGKGDKLRQIPIIDRRLLQDLIFQKGKYEAGRIFPWKQRQAQYILRRIGVEGGVKHPNPMMKYIHPHLFRHTIARHMKDQGYALEFIQKFLGHASMKTTADVYGTLSFDDMQKMVAMKSNDVEMMPRQEKVMYLE